MKPPHLLRPGNRYARETRIGRTLGELVRAKMALVRRCKHCRVLYPANLIPRFGETCPAIELRERSLRPGLAEGALGAYEAGPFDAMTCEGPNA
jgi:hypothetical protein